MKFNELMKSVGAVSKHVYVHYMDVAPTIPAFLRITLNRVPKWTQLGIVQIGILSIHCTLVSSTLFTVFTVDHHYITKLPPQALCPHTNTYQYKTHTSVTSKPK